MRKNYCYLHSTSLATRLTVSWAGGSEKPYFMLTIDSWVGGLKFFISCWHDGAGGWWVSNKRNDDDVKTQWKVVSDFSGKKGAFFPPPCDPFFFLGKKIFFEFFFAMNTAVQTFEIFFHWIWLYVVMRFFFQGILVLKLFWLIFEGFQCKQFFCFFVKRILVLISLQKKSHDYVQSNSVKKNLKSLYCCIHCKKNSKIFYSQFHWKKKIEICFTANAKKILKFFTVNFIEKKFWKFFRKSEKKIFA